MLFNYNIKLEISIKFEAPLLGTDTTISHRNKINKMALNKLKELINNDSVNCTKKNVIQKSNLNGNVNLSKKLVSLKHSDFN